MGPRRRHDRDRHGPDLGDASTYDVINPGPDLLLVSASSGSSGLAYIAAVDLSDNSASRAASSRIIRAGPTFASDGDFVCVDEGFSPNSLHQLDLDQPGFPIVLEDDHGDVSGTQRLDTTSFVQTGAFDPGIGVFSTSDRAFWSNETGYGSDGDLRRYDPTTTQELSVFADPCGFVNPGAGSAFEDAVGRFIITAGSEVCILAVPTLCFGQTSTVDLGLGESPTNGADVILGTPGPDVIDALGGDDRICALGGAVDIGGGDGGDFIDAGDDDDDDDTIYGNNGAGTLRGGPHLSGDYCNGGALNSYTGDTAKACETVLNAPLTSVRCGWSPCSPSR